jgi:cation diffusion facilitator family transporter
MEQAKKNHQKAIHTAHLSIVGNLFLALIKGITGFLGNSFALIADAIESTTDVFSSLLVLFGLRYSVKPSDQNHPYGHGKAEPLITFIVVGFLIASATFIAIQSIHNIRSPQETPEAYTLIILGVIIVIKEVFYRIVNQKGKETRSTSLQADAWHHRSDAITSLVAFVGIAIALIMGKGYEQADDWAALAAAGFITYNAFLIFRPALGEIMDEHLHDDLILQIRKISKEEKEVIGTEKCHVRKSGMSYHVDLHLVVDGDITVREGHEIAHSLKNQIQKKLPEIADVLIHVEPEDELK